MDEIEEAVAWLRKSVEAGEKQGRKYVDYMTIERGRLILQLIDMEIE